MTPPNSPDPAVELQQLREERDFLLARSSKAGSFSMAPGRWTGMSSNALVDVAFGVPNGTMPYDGDDLAACYRAVIRMPAHIRTEAVFAQLADGEAHVARAYPSHVPWAKAAADWPGVDHLRAAQKGEGQ